MNKHESEVIMAQLMSERKTLRSIEAVYEQAMKDIDRKLRISDGKINTLLSDIDSLSDEEKSILQSQIYQRKFQRSLKSQLSIMLKDLTINQYSTVNEHLKNSYHNGYIGSLYTLNMQGIPLLMPIDPYLVHRAIETDSKISEGLWQNLVDKTDLFKRRIANHISRGIATAASYKDIAVWLRVGTKASIGRTMTVARTEGNRIYNAAALDCGKGAKKRGCDLVKVWDCTLDMKTRPTHRECDGQIKELDESFKNANGEAKAPGQFGVASEDINCRCAVLIKPRWDVDKSFTKMNNETGQLEGFEDVKGYAKFKKRFWEETEKKTSENKPKSIDFGGGSGIIESRIEYTTKPNGKIIATRYMKGEQKITLPNGDISIVHDPVYDNYEVFAGKGSDKELRVRDKLVENYGGKPENWFHAKGYTNVKDEHGVEKRANVHWFEEETVGIPEIYVKGWSKK